jgi:membrane associated rhomboid family serine protease
MIPLRDENPTYSTPVVTIALIVANVAVFLYQLSLGLNLSVFAYGLIPAELVHNANEVYAGRRLGLPPGVGLRNVDPAWMTVFTSMFMHGGWLHIIGNMWYLRIFGNNVEDAMGKGKFILFYLLCGIGAAAAQTALGPDSQIPMVGASGALAGVLGAYLVIFPGSRVLCLITTFVITTVELPAFLVLGFWFVLQVISGLGALGVKTGGVAYAAHVGGFALGWILVRFFHVPRHAPRRGRYREEPPEYTDWR